MVMILKKAGFLFPLFCLAMASLTPNDQAGAYVLPSRQVLGFMAPQFSNFETLVVEHTVERQMEEEVRVFEEILTMKGPDFIHAAAAEWVPNRNQGIDRSFRNLFFANSRERLMSFLWGAGVNPDRVSYTRVDGAVAYLIGERGPYKGQLAVEKARFLPLAFHYPSGQAYAPEFIRVTFRDYRQLDQGWYPFEIVCISSAGWEERYRVRSIEVNVPVDPSLLRVSQEEPRPAESPHKDERIDAIIRSLEQKYGR